MNPEARIVAAIKSAYEAQGYIVATERALGYGRADLVAYRIDPGKCRSRRENGQFRSLGRVEHYAVLRHLPELGQGSSTVEDLCTMLGRSPSFVRAALMKFLERSGYVARIGRSGFARVNGFIPIAKEIVAVEAKVSDWRKGAIQAKRYRWFADRVYLAVASEYIHRVQSELLRKHSIGLLAVDQGRASELITSPALPPRDPDRHSFASEWLWRYRRNAVLEAARIASEDPTS